MSFHNGVDKMNSMRIVKCVSCIAGLALALAAVRCAPQVEQIDMSGFSTFEYNLRANGFIREDICANAGAVICARLTRGLDGLILLDATVLIDGSDTLTNSAADAACQGSDVTRFAYVSRIITQDDEMAISQLFRDVNVFEYPPAIVYGSALQFVFDSLGKPTNQGGGTCSLSLFKWDDQGYSYDPTASDASLPGLDPSTAEQLITLVNTLAVPDK